ncbi:MAG: tryptophan synthase subunit alpha [Chloroflexi bacterium]|nr:tryptophan synthase subunit alpha [Chloroflexota bacterium]
MDRLSHAFDRKPVFMPYYPVGYPDLETSINVIEALAKHGADIIEVGFSFSDPLADGPIIQKATQTALEKGITSKKVLAAVAELRNRGVTIPLILMGYYNPMLAYGLENFILDAHHAGADGFIIPDLPPEEAGELSSKLGDLPQICMLAPTTSDDRMEEIARKAKGFIYLVSVTGVTGSRASLPDDIAPLIERVRKHTNIPVCVGFGIGTPEQAQTVGTFADGVIVGSACVRTIGESQDPVKAAGEFASLFAAALGREKKTSIENEPNI